MPWEPGTDRSEDLSLRPTGRRTGCRGAVSAPAGARTTGARASARLGLAAILAAAAIFAAAPLPAAAQPPPDHDQEQDGRLGGGKGDYICYSRHGFLEVWRYDPVLRRGVLLKRIPLSGPGGVDRLHQQGDHLIVPAEDQTITLTRWGEQIEVSGLFNGANPFGPNLHTLRAHDVLGPHTPFRNQYEKTHWHLMELRSTLDFRDPDQHLANLEMARQYLQTLDSAIREAAAGAVSGILRQLADFGRALAEREARLLGMVREAAELAGDDPRLQGLLEDVQRRAREELEGQTELQEGVRTHVFISAQGVPVVGFLSGFPVLPDPVPASTVP